MEDKIQKFEPIDCLRGIAAVMVVFVHSSLFAKYQNLPELLNKFIYQGTRGVQLFYIISAFTLFYTFDLRKEDKNATTRFLVRRFFRIAPLFYFSIILYLSTRYFGFLNHAYGDFPSIFNVISNFIFLHGFSPFWTNDIVPGSWSIGVEFPFYFFLPLLFYWIKNLKQAIQFQIGFVFIAIFLQLFMLSVKNFLPNYTWVGFINQFFPLQLIHFGFGIILFFIIVKNEKITNENYKLIYLILLEYFINFIMSTYYLSDWMSHNLIISNNFSLGFSIGIYFLINDKIFVLNNKIFKFLGKISYGLYLVHFFCYYTLDYFGLNNLISGDSGKVSLLNFIIRLILCLGLASTFAYFLHIIIEKPFQNIGKKLIEKYL